MEYEEGDSSKSVENLVTLSFAVSENEIFELNETLDRGNNSGQQTPGAKEGERNPAIYFTLIIRFHTA